MQTVTDDDIRHYEGLVRKTAAMYVAIVEDDYDDICSVLRIKVWQALLAWDTTKAKQSKDAYVFMCLKNRVKDLVKKVRRNELYIEDIAPNIGNESTGKLASDQRGSRDRFESRYLVALEEQVFGDLDKPLIPSTITGTERKVIAYLHLDLDHGEIAEVLGWNRKEVATTVRTIREKMADWKPSPRATPVRVAESASDSAERLAA